MDTLPTTSSGLEGGREREREEHENYSNRVKVQAYHPVVCISIGSGVGRRAMTLEFRSLHLEEVAGAV